MKTTLKDIKSLIKDKLESIVDDNEKSIFGDIFDYSNGEFKNYPVAVILNTGVSGEELDTGRNQRIFHFVINLYQEQSSVGRSSKDADDVMTNVSDKIIEAFDKDPDLGGEVINVRVIEATFDFIATAGSFNFATFKIDCTVVVNNYL
ncbi:MAG: hypothetical protein GX660_26205 [Clostridiaceae bacterium]|nr:hypothetical protein [Clostridiaceae bacterium]